jgi:DNA polymerase III delta prime subunit
MDLPAQAYVRRILRTNHHLVGFEDAGNFLREESKEVRHFVSALRLSIEELPEKYKFYFSKSRVLNRPWMNPGLEELYKISIRNNRPLSYSVQLIYRLNGFLFQSMRRQGFIYSFDNILWDDIPVPPKPKYPAKDYALSKQPKASNDASKPINQTNNKEYMLAKLSEIELFDLLKTKCKENNVPSTIIPKLLPVLMKYTKTKKAPTILLTGNPGVGKTTLSRIISDLLGLELRLVSAQSTATSRGLVGDAKTYRNAGCGIIADAKQRFGDAFVLIVDEIDKVSSRRDCVHNLQDEILSAIDGSRSVHDLFLDEDISTDSIFFILTANDERAISPWLRDRCSVIHFPNPDYERVLSIVSKRANELSESEPYEGRINLDKELVEYLVSRLFTQGQTSLRQYLAVVDDLFDKAYLLLLETRKTRVEISKEMLLAVIKAREGNGKSKFGFEI